MIVPERKQNTGALVVAAGLSRRMGALKPLLPLGDTTLLRCGVERLCAFGCAPVAVVLGREAERVEASLSGLEVECVFNPAYAECQMLESVKLGLKRLQGRCDRFFFTPGDVPLFLPETLRTLAQQSSLPVCPTFGGRRGHPVLLPSELIPSLLSYDGPGGLRGALDTLGGLREMSVDDPGILLDADTPEDYQVLCKLYAQREGTA